MKKLLIFIFVLFSLFIIHYSLFIRNAFAVCPVCTVAVGAGLGLSRYLGIDDSISGIWVGGLIVSLTLWTVDWLKKKNWKITKRLSGRVKTLLSLLFWIILTYPPLAWAGIIGHPFNTILGIDKLIFGSVLGAIAFSLGVWADKKVRLVKGRQLLNYQKVAFPVLSLLIFSLVLYYFGGYLYGLN